MATRKQHMEDQANGRSKDYALETEQLAQGGWLAVQFC